MKHKLGFLVILGLLVFGIHTAFAAGDTSVQSQSRSSQQSAMGTIDKITDDKITVKTEDGKTHSYTISQTQRDQIKGLALREGDQIGLSLNKQNQIVSVNKSNESGGDHFNSNRGPSPNPGAGSPGSEMSPNSGTGIDPNSGTGKNPNTNPNTGTGSMGSGPNSGVGGGMNGGSNSGVNR